MHSFQGNTALLAAFSLEKPRLDIFELLIRAGAKVNPEGSIDEDRKLLQEAVRSRNCDLVKLLIKEGANFNRSWDLDGDNIPLALAADDGLFEIMYILLNAGARVKNADRLTARIPGNLRNGKDYKELLSKLKLTSERNKEISASDRRRSLVT
jgi:ankyrin repeat protein